MGTTRDALNAGSCTLVLSAVIEGYSQGFTNGDTAAMATAYAGTGWSTFVGGLFVDIQISQGLNPDEPIVDMGTCTLTMMPQATGAADLFGVAVGRKTSPYETYLDAAVNNTDTSITVKSTSGWPSSGYLHIGTECMHYSAIADATHFTIDQRGCFTPFGSFDNYINGDTTNSFSHVHNVHDDANSINLAPLVSSTPRIWAGRWVRVRAHRVVGGVIDTVAEAETIFAGQIHDIRDDPNTGAVVIQLRPATDLNDITIGQRQWEGSAEDGVYLSAGDVFRFIDTGGTATNLTVVASGAVAPYQIDAGAYTLGDLCAALSAWLAQAKTDGDIDGTYSVASPVSIPGGALLTKVYWILPGLGQVSWALSMPPRVSTFLGFENIEKTDPDPSYAGNRVVQYVGPGASTLQHWHEGTTPKQATIETNSSGIGTFDTDAGELVDQSAQLSQIPGLLGGAISLIGGSWAMFSIGKSRTAVAKFTDNADGTYRLEYVTAIFPDPRTPDYSPISVSVNGGDSVRFRQIYLLESDPITMVISLLCSMGTDGYNSPYTALPPGCSASVPYELVQSLPNTMSGLSGITIATGMTIILEKPTKLAELIRSDFAARWVFLCWRNGEISMGEWRSPTSALASVTLSDSNKASPAGRIDNQRTATTETSEWLRPIVKVRYNRITTNPSGDDYLDTATFIDGTSVENMGGAAKTVTLNLRNTYDQLTGPAQSIESLLARFLAVLPLCSRPARKAARAIDSRYFWQLGLGDVVFLSDTFARDPETGLRGITSRPALVTKLTWNLGGEDVGGSITPMGGTVELLFTDQNPDKLGATYVPAAMVNDVYSVGSYDHGYLLSGPTLKLLTNRFTETTDTGGRDSSHLNPGDNIIIIERDPPDPDAPVKWLRTIAANGISGDEVTLTAALSSPAWDNTKQYYIISQTYSAATATQHEHAYQADVTDALIEDSASPYLYGSGSADSTYTSNTSMDSRYPFSYVNDVEMPPTLVRIDGAGRDVAWEASLVRLLNNLIDYKLQPQLPMLSNVEMINSTVTGTGYQLVDYFPIFLNYEIPSSTIYRLITMAVWARSTDGTPTKIRVTLSRERPSFPTTDNVAWSGTFAQYEWTGITSTTATTLADGTATVNIKNAQGECWVAIECGYKCATRGLAKFVVGARQTA